jgi:hypothetical protein
MADSTTHLDLIQGSQLQKEVTFNELVDALSPATLYGRRASGCSGLIWQSYGGLYRENYVGGLHFQMAANSNNYFVADRLTGIMTHSTVATNWNDDGSYMRLYLVITDSFGVTSYEDHRSMHDRVLP